MSRRFLSIFIPFLMAAPIALAQPKNAADLIVRVHVETKSPPSQVLGLVLSKQSATQEKDTKVTKIGDYLYEVVFKVPSSMVDDSSVGTALVITKDEQWVFGSMTPTLASNPDGNLLNVPQCAPTVITDAARQEDMALYTSLNTIRSAQADLLRMKVSRLMNDEFLLKLQQTERAFGISRTSELSADLPPAELVDRLARLSDAIRDYKKAQQSRE